MQEIGDYDFFWRKEQFFFFFKEKILLLALYSCTMNLCNSFKNKKLFWNEIRGTKDMHKFNTVYVYVTEKE